MNCLAHCLDQWLDNPEFRLWYNSNHVIIIEPHLDASDLGYLPLSEFGYFHMILSFQLSPEYTRLLTVYFDSL